MITGGVLENNLKKIGSDAVTVPNQFYKIVFRKNGDSIKSLAFLFPNKESQKPLDTFLVSIDAIEVLTGIDFFYKKPKNWQDAIEETSSQKGWKF